MTPPHAPGRRQELLAAALMQLTEPSEGRLDLHTHTALLVSHGTRLVDEAEVGVLMADEHGALHAVDASTEIAFVFTEAEAATADGPSRHTYATGGPVTAYDLTAQHSPWTHLTGLASEAGYRSLHTVAMRHAQAQHGVLGFYRPTTTRYSGDDRTCAQVLADTSAIVLAHSDALERRQALAEHIQRAFATRVAIEQAKGLLSERLGISPDEAFEVLRAHARSRGMKIHALAQGLLDGTLTWPSTP